MGESRDARARVVGRGAAFEDEERDRRSKPPAPVHFRVGGSSSRANEVKKSIEDSAEGMQVDATSLPRGTDRRDAKFAVGEDDDDDDDDVVVAEDGNLAAMQAMMGFGGFGTTKQKQIAGNDVGAVRKEKKTEYRQYMNRVGGFNRPLSPGK